MVSLCSKERLPLAGSNERGKVHIVQIHIHFVAASLWTLRLGVFRISLVVSALFSMSDQVKKEDASGLYVIKRSKLKNPQICQSLVPAILELNFAFFVHFLLDGEAQPIYLDKITSRIEKLCYGLKNEFVEPVRSHFRLRNMPVIEEWNWRQTDLDK